MQQSSVKLPLALNKTMQRQQQASELHQLRIQEQLVVISTPAQVTLPAQCGLAEAQQLLTAAGTGTYPALMNPLLSAPPNSAAADIPAPRSCDAPYLSSPAVATSHSSSGDGHTLGALLSVAGLLQLVLGDCDPVLKPPVVLQQFLPHGQALYKLYVIGPHVILTRRSTLTMQQIEEQAAAAAATATQSESRAAGVVLGNRVSAVPLQPTSQEVTFARSYENAVDLAADRADTSHTPATEQHWQQQQQQQKQEHLDRACGLIQASDRLQACLTTHTGPLSGTQQQQQQQQQPSCPETLGNTSPAAATAHPCSTAGVASCDSSVEGDAAAPPLWAMRYK